MKFLRLNPRKLKFNIDKYIIEDELTSIIYKKIFEVDIQYIEPVKFNYDKIDPRYQKILSLKCFIENNTFNNFYYIDHDTIILPDSINSKKINAYIFKNKISSAFIDLKIFKQYINSFRIIYFKKINYEEYQLSQVLKDFNLNFVNGFSMHYTSIKTEQFIIKYRKKFDSNEIRHLFNLIKKLKAIYEKK